MKKHNKVLALFVVSMFLMLSLLSGCSQKKSNGEEFFSFDGRVAMITEVVILKDAYMITVDTDNKQVYEELNNAEFSLNNNDMVIVIEEDNTEYRVLAISGDIPFIRGTIEKSKLSYDTTLFMNNANQTIINDVMSYDGIDGNEIKMESGIGMVKERKDDWTRASLPGLESDLWFKSDSLSYEFDTSVTDIKK